MPSLQDTGYRNQLAEPPKWSEIAMGTLQAAAARRLAALQSAAQQTSGNTGIYGGSLKGTNRISAADWKLAQKWGNTYHVDPRLLVAIGFHETGWGTLGAGRKGLTLGVGAYDSGATYRWAGLNNQLAEGAKILAKHGVYNINDVMAGKARWWATEPSWKNGVATWFNRLWG